MKGFSVAALHAAILLQLNNLSHRRDVEEVIEMPAALVHS